MVLLPDGDRPRWPYQDIEAAASWRRVQRWQGSLADLIEYFCSARGITGVELAHRIGHETSGFVSRLRHGKIPVTHRTLQALTKALDLTALEERLLYAVAGDFSVVPIPPQRLGALVASLRDRDEMSQEELAEKMGLDPSTVSRLEHGHRPDDDELKKLTQVLPSARDNPLVFFAAGRLPPEDLRRADEVALAEFAEYVYWLRISQESYREALELIEPNLKLIGRLALTPAVKEHYTVEILNSYADCLLMTGQMDEAMPITQRALRGALRRSNPIQASEAQTLSASISYALDRDRDAVQAAEYGIELMESLTHGPRRGGFAWSYEQLQLKRTVSLAYVAHSVGRLDSRYLAQVDPWLARKMELPDYAADAYGRQAELRALAGDVEGALRAWEAQRKAAASHGTPDIVLFALMNGAEIALLGHELVEAERLVAESKRHAYAHGLGYAKSNIERVERKVAGETS